MSRIPAGPARPPARWILAILLVSGMSFGYLGVVPGASASTITVTTHEDQLNSAAPCSLREAVLSANNDSAVGGCPAGSGADTIVLGAGEYFLRIPADDPVDEEVGDLDLTSDITLVGQGAGVTVIDGAWRFDTQSDRILEIGEPLDVIIFRGGERAQAPNVVVENLTIQDGEPAFGFGPNFLISYTGDGGGIFVNHDANLVARNVVIDHNAADEGDGGGLAVWEDGTATLQNVRFTRNIARNGGAIYNEGTITATGGSIGSFEGIRDRWVDRNTTQFGDGGGIFNVGQATLRDMSIVGNLAHSVNGDGGGIWNANELTLERSIVYSNHAQRDGGGIYSTVADDTLNLTNVTVSTNSADDHGGGLYNQEATANLTNVTMAFNRADEDNNDICDGGGIYESTGDTVNLRNTILAGNVDRSIDEDVHPDCSGPMTSGGNNLVQRTDGCTGLGASDLTGVDPLLASLADNGGPTLTHALLPGSPAVDRAGSAPSDDQRGVPRPYGPAPDIGAYERFLCFGYAINVVGTAASELIDAVGGPPTDVILGLGGNDTIVAGPGADFICGGDGNDLIKAGSGRDKANGENGNDRLRGGGNPDLLLGGAGNDRFYGGGTLREKGDKCQGGPGKDKETGCEITKSV